MDYLVSDNLDYSCAWTVVPQPIRLIELVGQMGVGLDVREDLSVMADNQSRVLKRRHVHSQYIFVPAWRTADLAEHEVQRR